MKNLSLAWKTSLPVLVFTVVLLFVVGLFLFTLGRTQVNGPIYSRIVEGKDVIADVLPPPLFIVEADHLAWELTAAETSSEQQSLVQAIREQKTGPGGLDERSQFWASRLEAGPVRSALLDEAVPTAEAYFQVFESQVVPALKKGGILEVRAAVAGPLARAFDLHHDAVEQVVEAANALNQGREAEARSESSVLLAWTLGLSAVGLVLAAVFSLMISRQLTRAIHTVLAVADGVTDADEAKIRAAGALAQGDLTVEIPPAGVDISKLLRGRTDEVGRLHQAFAGMVASQEELAHSLTAVTMGLQGLVGDIRLGAEEVAAGAKQIADTGQHLSSGASTQAAAVEEVSAALNQVGGQVRANADRAEQARSHAEAADHIVLEGLAQMRSLVEAMDTLELSSRQVSRIVKVSDDIAFQVNLLSLNAAVEAARAGSHGKGFAVVAQEIRTLATSSAKAAHETEQLIHQSLDQIRRGAALTRENSAVLENIRGTVSQTGTLVAEMAEASRDQEQGLQQVIQALTQIEAVTQSNTATAEQTAAASLELTQKSRDLRRLTQKFRLKA